MLPIHSNMQIATTVSSELEKQKVDDKKCYAPNYQLHTQPEWSKILPVYEQIREGWLSKMKPTDNQIIEARIINDLKRYSSCPQGSDLKSHLNQGLDYQSFRPRYECCFGSIQTLDKVRIYIFSDNTQKTMSHDFKDNSSKNKAVLIDMSFFGKTYAEYQAGYEEYKQMSKGIDTPGDRELYFAKTGMAQMGHVAVAYLSQTSKEYDFFDTSFTLVGKYIAAIAMKEAYQRKESEVSAADYDTSGVCYDKYNLCNQYVLAYLIARQTCEDHVLISHLFQKMLASTKSEEFISIIAGLGALNLRV